MHTTIGVLFRLVGLSIEGAGLDGFCFIDQGHLLFPKDTYAHDMFQRRTRVRFGLVSCNVPLEWCSWLAKRHMGLPLSWGRWSYLGPSVVPLLTLFLGKGSPTKIEYREKRVPLF